MGLADAAGGAASGAAAGAMGGPVGSLIGAGIGLFASLFGAHKQASTAKNIAKTQADAQARSDAIAQKAADDALAFQREESARTRQSEEAARRGNYQWDAARDRRIGSIGEMVGLGPRDTPAYVPIDGGQPPATSAPAGPAPAVDASKGDIGQQVSAYFKSRGVDDHETPAWIGYWQQFGAKDPAYFNQRLADADVFRGGKPAVTAQPVARAPLPYDSIASFASKRPRALTPALQPGSISDYAGGY